MQPLRVPLLALLTLAVSTCTAIDSPTDVFVGDVAPSYDYSTSDPAVWDGGGGDGQWSNPLNWSQDVLPGVGDPVQIVDAGTVHVDVDASVGPLRFGTVDPSANPVPDELIIDSGVELTVSDDPTDYRITIHFSETVTIEGTLTLADAATFNAGTHTNNGLIRVLDGASLSQHGGPYQAQASYFGSTFVNNGTIESSGRLEFGSTAQSGAGVTINNGTIELTNSKLGWQGMSETVWGDDVAHKYDFHNTPNGVIRGTGYVILGRSSTLYDGERFQVPFRNDGTIDLTPGSNQTWTITAYTSVQNTGSIGASSGEVVLDCLGDIYPRGTVTSPVNVKCLTWTGNGTTDNWTEAANWTNQQPPVSGTTLPIVIGAPGSTALLDMDFTAGGRFEVTHQASLTVASDNTLTLDGSLGLFWGASSNAALVNFGTVAVNGAVMNQGVIDNQGDMSVAAAFDNQGSTTSSGTFNNAGPFSNTGSVANSGTMVNSGSVENRSAFVNTGTFGNTNSFTNYATLTNEADLVNTGVILNATNTFSDRAKLHNTATGSVANTGTIEAQQYTAINNDGAITNGGSIVMQCRSELNDNGTITGTAVHFNCGIWDGGGGNELWSNPLNWVGDVLPGLGDPVQIVDAGTVHVDVDASVGPLRFGTADPSANPVVDELIIDSGVELTVSDDPTDYRITIQFSETVTIEGTLTLADAANFNAGTHTNNGLIRVLDGASLSQHGGPYQAQASYFGSTFVNNGTIESSGRLEFGSTAQSGAGVTINNGTIELTNSKLGWQGMSETVWGDDVAHKYDFHNTPNGVIRGTGYVILGRSSTLYDGERFQVPFRNDGTIDLTPGSNQTWTITNHTTIQNGGTIAGGGELKIEGAVINACGGSITLPTSGNPVTQLPCNDAPVVDAGDDASVDEGSAFALAASFVDPDTPPHAATVDWDDGEVTELTGLVPGPIDASHTYADDGVFSVSVCVTDGEPATGCDNLTVTVNNVPPSVDLTGPEQAGEGASVEYTFTMSDPGADLLTVAVACGSGLPSAMTTSAAGGTFSCTFSDGPAAEEVSITVSDDDGGSAVATVTTTVLNVAPTVDLVGPVSVDEGSTAAYGFTVSDPGDDSWTVTAASCGAGALAGDPNNGGFQCSFPEGPSTETVSVTVTDDDGGSTEADYLVSVDNVAPVLGAITTPADPQSVHTAVTVSAPFTDVGVLDTHAATVDWGDESTTAAFVDELDGSGTITADHAYSQAGIYTLRVHVQDDDGASAEAFSGYVVVYDPAGGFVTGGGWIHSAEGAHVADPGVVGRASFGLVAKYRKGANAPTGNTQFQFKAGDLNFHSDVYDFLVVTQGGRSAQFKGSGTINGGFAPNGAPYRFMIWAGDGSPDTFRIRIWWEDGESEETEAIEVDIYDNGFGQEIGGGSIVIHSK